MLLAISSTVTCLQLHIAWQVFVAVKQHTLYVCNCTLPLLCNHCYHTSFDGVLGAPVLSAYDALVTGCQAAEARGQLAPKGRAD